MISDNMNQSLVHENSLWKIPNWENARWWTVIRWAKIGTNDMHKHNKVLEVIQSISTWDSKMNEGSIVADLKNTWLESTWNEVNALLSKAN